ncbi:hypothetical protein TNCV_4577341 [Trichonephila clavipes]|nr:hypothetical protein TNCV_4577341 [Trichonephila clavipes]
MNEQQKALLESINALKSGKEETKQEMKKCQEALRDTLEKKIDSVEERIAVKMEEKIAGLEEEIREENGRENRKDYIYIYTHTNTHSGTLKIATQEESIGFK